MTTYGFNRQRASRLRRLADTAGLSPADQGGLRYPGSKSFLPGIPFVNKSGETAPGYAVMQITDQFAATSTTPWGFEIGKQDDQYHGLHLVNGPDPVVNNDIGTGYFYMGDYPEQPALYNTANTPLGGESWGVVEGSWYLQKHGPGFYILGGAVSAEAKVNIIQYIPGELLVKNVSGGDYAANSGPHEVEVYGGVMGSETGSGLLLEAYNRTSVAFKNNKFGAVGFMNGQPYVVRLQE